MFDVIRLYRDFSVPHLTEGNKHCTRGWVNTHCPFCSGSQNYHLGATLEGTVFRCWRCGWKPASLSVARLLNVTEYKAETLIKQYTIRRSERPTIPMIRIGAKPFRLPTATTELIPTHRRYLTGRGFDHERLEREWGLLSTGPISMLDGIDYKHRILAPIFWNDQAVSFHARDVTGRHPLKYMACPREREIIHHKHLLYGKQEAWLSAGICVEGIVDVWRLGELAFAVFGIEFTVKQITEIVRHFRRVFVLFDEESQAQTQAKRMVSELMVRGVDAHLVSISGDPGGMEQSEANHLVKQLIH